jgi:branched-chain amino acid transport system ATP-binding protein
MLKVEDLHCGYGAVRAVQGVSFEIPKGKLLALLGPNGAGKTSTIMALMGHVAVTRGSATFDDVDLLARRPLERPALGVSVVPEGRLLFMDLSVEENLTVGGYWHSLARDRVNRQLVYDLFPRLAERRRQMAGSMSGGEQQMLAMGRALMAQPRLLLIDELSLGLTPKMVDLCFDALRRLQIEGLSVLLVDQSTARALEVADRVCIMASGRIVFDGLAETARTKEDLFSAFLGESGQQRGEQP